ncbi:molybdopterin molybdochelatase [Gemmobacter caeni]|uniref:Molybdopterin molybdenumtransferase n=1 Tax=Gemmobacter caeni TaxID=589035 RepID=A0A2T6B753_9RHOB|nr:molybdopterin molybdotransferase MoeA [Gemmobacter caeni]PTX51868.1 molybdopterin molybdochelatase [Gemmobacter caeni]TWJ03996.1 molybdopterin molybdochelatase [Gemmobacter caeni]
MISVEEALARVLALATPMPVETVPLAAAAGRWMAKAAEARRTQPPFASSAMDGYAVQGPAATGARFRVIGESAAGHGFAGSVGPGEAARIFTGAPVPEGATQVVLQEDVTRDGNDIVIATASANGNIRQTGDDFAAGFRLQPRRISASDVALLAAMNLAEVPAHRRPVVAIIATGDELVMPGDTPGPDQIIASNSFAIKALAEGVGAEARLLPIARDTEASLRAVFALAEGADLVVTIGGASVGDHDLVAKVATDLGMKRAFYKISMRPGKPLMAGRLNGMPMLGLPGNPVSAIVCAHLFLLPLLRAMQGEPAPAPAPRRAVLGADVAPTGPRTHYMRARIEDGVVTAFDRQDSALLSVLAEANALLIRPLGDGARKAGEAADYLPI